MVEKKNINRREFLKQVAIGAIIGSTGNMLADRAWTQISEPTQEAKSEVALNNKKVRLNLTGEKCLICSPWVGVDLECELVFSGKGDLKRCLTVAEGCIRKVTAPKSFEEWSSIPRSVLEKLILEEYEKSRSFYNQNLGKFAPLNVKLVSVKILTFRLSPGGPHWPPVRK
ncbi:MAG: hypothetical protein DRI52_05390 [Chloroflexi bacterium]|nr:MAG: hypothetical protein DRI52_05390 [Chloroflexota bacterium]